MFPDGYDGPRRDVPSRRLRAPPFMMEFVLTAMLMFVIMGVATDDRAEGGDGGYRHQSDHRAGSARGRASLRCLDESPM